MPIHLAEPYRAQGHTEGECPVAEAAHERFLSLPIHPRLTEEAIDYMAAAVAEMSSGKKRDSGPTAEPGGERRGCRCRPADGAGTRCWRGSARCTAGSLPAGSARRDGRSSWARTRTTIWATS